MNKGQKEIYFHITFCTVALLIFIFISVVGFAACIFDDHQEIKERLDNIEQNEREQP